LEGSIILGIGATFPAAIVVFLRLRLACCRRACFITVLEPELFALAPLVTFEMLQILSFSLVILSFSEKNYFKILNIILNRIYYIFKRKLYPHVLSVLLMYIIANLCSAEQILCG